MADEQGGTGSYTATSNGDSQLILGEDGGFVLSGFIYFFSPSLLSVIGTGSGIVHRQHSPETCWGLGSPKKGKGAGRFLPKELKQMHPNGKRCKEKKKRSKQRSSPWTLSDRHVCSTVPGQGRSRTFLQFTELGFLDACLFPYWSRAYL